MIAWCSGGQSMLGRLQLWVQRLRELVHDWFEPSPATTDSWNKAGDRRRVYPNSFGVAKPRSSSTWSPAVQGGWQVGRWWWSLQGSLPQSCLLFGLVSASILILGPDLTEQLAQQIRDLRPF